MIQQNPYPLRIDSILMEKIKVIAAENGRSVNKEIEFLVKQSIKKYEEANGTIDVQNGRTQ